LEQGFEASATIQRNQIVAPSHVGLADEDLWHRATSGDGHHVFTLLGIGVDADLFDVGHAFGFEDLLGTDAVRANGGGVHLDGGHEGLQKAVGFSGFDDGLAGLAPGFEATGQGQGLGIAQFFGHGDGTSRTHAAGTNQDQGLVLVAGHLGQLFFELIQGDVFGAGKMTVRPEAEAPCNTGQNSMKPEVSAMVISIQLSIKNFTGGVRV
jgi:hypothetical protein